MAVEMKMGGMESKRTLLDSLRASLWSERSSFDSHWKDIADHVRPRRARFQVSETNRGDKKNQKIINSRATTASRTMRSGMMGGITSPAEQWFRLTAPNPELTEDWEVKEWLDRTTEIMNAKIHGSNFYDTAPTFYSDLGDFGTSPMFVEEDFESVFNTEVFPVGSYVLGNDARGRVRVFGREFQLTVRQLIERYGVRDEKGNVLNWENFSDTVHTAWEKNELERWIVVCHIIQENRNFDPNRLGAKFMRYSSDHFETGGGRGHGYLTDSDNGRFLKESGYKRWPVLVGRWDKNAEDVYSTDSPGMTCLGDIKSLQTMERRLAQAVEKGINPPMTGPTSLANSAVSILPGGNTWVDVRDGQSGFRPAHEVRVNIADLRINIQECEARISRAYYEDLFLMLANDDRAERPTAEEVRVRQQEKLGELGPVLAQLNVGVLKPFIEMVFAFCFDQGYIPEPPESLRGQDIKIEFVSVMAKAQKLMGAASVERFSGFMLNIAQLTGDPSALDKWDIDQTADEYSTILSIKTSMVRSDEKVAEMRESRAQAQQQAVAAQQAKDQASAVKQLADAKVTDDSALAQMA